MRTEELVGGAGEEIAVQRLHVDQTMRRELDGVDENECADSVRHPYDFSDIRYRTGGVGGVCYGDEAGARGERLGKAFHVEGGVFGVYIDDFDDRARFFHIRPGRHVGIVIEGRDDDFVARFERTSDRVGEVEGECRHARSEQDRVGIGGVEQVCHRLARAAGDGIGALTAEEGSAAVRVGVAVVAGDGVDHRLRHLGSAGAVEEHGGLPVVFGEPQGEGGELGANGIGIEVHGTAAFFWFVSGLLRRRGRINVVDR